MKKRWVVVLLVVVLFLAGALGASAQLRLDGNISWPFLLGIELGDYGGTSSSAISSYAFLFPDIQLSYQFGGQVLRGGIGLRAFTLIIESAGWPIAYFEAELKPIVLRAEIGGGWFFAFGLANASTTARVVIADVSASWKLAEWFRLGVGGLAVAPFDATQNFGYAVYVNGRFTALFGGKGK
ncbi:MAG: hypothetical protein NT005_09180 [Spirochaetes bacterium]|nr:hypothetical protein [Spirochaetota bacterium]